MVNLFSPTACACATEIELSTNAGYSIIMNDPHLLDLHSELQNDSTGKRRTELLGHLRELHNGCLTAQRALCDREVFKRLEASTLAVSAAIKIIEKLPDSGNSRN